MKKIFLIIPLLAMMLAPSCEQMVNPDAEGTPGADLTDGVNSIAAMAKQIEAMQTSIKLLEQANKEILASIDKLQNSGAGTEGLDELKKQQQALADDIKEIETALNDIKEWASDNFATSGQLESLSETIEGLSAAVDSLQKQIEALGGTSGGFVSLIQSVQSMIPDNYAEIRKAYPYDISDIYKFSYSVYPKHFAKQLADNYQNTLTLQFTKFKKEILGTFETQWGLDYNTADIPVEIHKLPLNSCTADETTGILTVEIAGKDIPEEFYFNYMTASYGMLLCISDGTNQIQSDAVDVTLQYASLREEYFSERFGKEGGSWKLKEKYGIEEEIIAVVVSEDQYVNAEKWLSAELDEATGEVNVTMTENSSEDRTSVITVFTVNSYINITCKQYGKPWTLEADKTEVMFTEDGGEAIVTVKCNRNAEIIIENYHEWIYVEHPWNNNGSAEMIITVQQTNWWDYSFSSSREALITVRDNRGTTLEINVSQSLPAPEGITASPEELTIPWEGGVFDILLQHSAGGRITGIDHNAAPDVNIWYLEPQPLTDELTLLKSEFGPNDWPTARSGYIIVYYDSPEYGPMEIVYNIRHEARPLE